MHILFQVEKKDEKIIKVKPLFPNEDTCYHSTGLDTIKKTLNNLVDSLNNDKTRQITFPSIYVGNIKFNDVHNSRTFDILVRLKNGYPDDVLRVSDNYGLNDVADLLNQENKDETISYKVMQCRGELE